MRHALGLRGNNPSRSTADHPTASTSGSQPPRRRFVRDGEVPVTVIRRNRQPGAESGTNQLDAARNAIRSQAVARERAERSVEEAQVIIRDLQTKLVHERLAKNEALETVRRQTADEQSVRQTLLTNPGRTGSPEVGAPEHRGRPCRSPGRSPMRPRNGSGQQSLLDRLESCRRRHMVLQTRPRPEGRRRPGSTQMRNATRPARRVRRFRSRRRTGRRSWMTA
jgi:hypothetical protein